MALAGTPDQAPRESSHAIQAQAPDSERFLRVSQAMSMTPEELEVVRGYFLRVAPPGSPPGADGPWSTREAFVALGTAFSYWLAETLVSGQDLAHGELLLRSSLFNMGVAREMLQRYAAVEAANVEHVREIAVLRAKLYVAGAARAAAAATADDSVQPRTPLRRRRMT